MILISLAVARGWDNIYFTRAYSQNPISKTFAEDMLAFAVSLPPSLPLVNNIKQYYSGQPSLAPSP